MTAKILDSFGGKLAEKWAATLLTPAFVFWLGGFIAILQHWDWDRLVKKFSLYSAPLQTAILVGCLCLIAASAFVIQRFDWITLRVLEGYYWPPVIGRIRVRHYELHRKQLVEQGQVLRQYEDKERHTFQRLKVKIETQGASALSQADKEKYLQLDKQLLDSDKQSILMRTRRQLRNLPAVSDLMPTRLGNLIRATERRPLARYGLDAVVCWPYLWLVIPDTAKRALQHARSDLNSSARLCLWSLLFLSWVALGAWWVIPIGILSSLFAYYIWALAAARAYSDLIEAAFALYRFELYEQLRWPLPSDPAAERESGRALTAYLRQGSNQPYPQFVVSEDP